MTRRYNLRRIKQHECYTAPELVALFKVSLGTVRRWAMDGLRPIDRRRPHLYLGSNVAVFLKARQKPHEPLAPGEFFCVCCKAKRRAASEVLGLILRSPTTVDLTAACAACGRRLFRRTRISEIDQKVGLAKLICEEATITVTGNREPHQMSLFEGIGQ